jgi:predicted  nucleic acid-binding Zn-ribbon protein
MGLVIRNLLALQEVDLQMLSLEEERAKLSESIERQKAEVQREREEVAEREARLKRIKVEIKSSEAELAETGEHIRKFEGQQILVKTNQEYKALDKEIYEAKARQAQVEDALLEKMEQLEEETEALRQGRQKLDNEISELERETGGADEKVREVEQEIAVLREKRAEIASTIERVPLSLYERIFRKKKGAALAPLVNRACQGCHLSVPAGVESVLRRHASNVITCENCSRILYVPEEEPEEAE